MNQATENKKEKTPQGISYPKLFTVKGGAKYLGITEWHMRQIIWHGCIPIVELPPNKKKQYLCRDDLDALISQYRKTIE